MDVKIRKFIFNKRYGTGAVPDPKDEKDYSFDEIAVGAPSVDWETGYDVERDVNIEIPIKNQSSSNSCVGQAWSYYVAVLNALEVGYYDEASAKAFYSQIFLPGGGAYIRDGAKLAVNWGAVLETIVSSYKNGAAPDEAFMRDLSWKTDNVDRLAKILRAKEYRVITNKTMDMYAIAIRDGKGTVSGLIGENNGSWSGGEPKSPTSSNTWAHGLYFGKYGIDSKGKFIATPNSWGGRLRDSLHPDGWQKLREDYFAKDFMFNPWTLIDQPNEQTTARTKGLMENSEKKLIVEGEGPGRKGIIVNGKLMQITKEREAVAAIYVLTNSGFGVTVDTQTFNEMTKGNNF